MTESTDKITIDKIKELPEKVAKQEIKHKEDKKVVEKKEQLVPKMVVSFLSIIICVCTI